MRRETSIYLNAVRFFAALVVFLGHTSGRRFTDGFLWAFGEYMDVAVIIFFVLSGYVIAYVTDNRERSLDDYAINRVARILSVAMPALIETCLRDAEAQAAARQITLHRDYADNLPVVELDAAATRKSLGHILDNAIRYTPVGGMIRIYVLRVQRQISIAVQDGGPGISREDLAKVLNPFWLAEPTLTKRHGGIGLGLPLSRRLIELQGGQLDIASHIGAGTRVTLRFPLRMENDNAMPAPVPREAVGWAE